MATRKSDSPTDLRETIEALEVQRNELQGRARFLERLIHSSLNGVYIYNLREGTNTFVNDRYTQLTGFTLDDLNALKDDMDDEMGATKYGGVVKSRNINALKMISTVLIALIGLAELYAIFV